MYVPTHRMTFCGYTWVEITAPRGEMLNLSIWKSGLKVRDSCFCFCFVFSSRLYDLPVILLNIESCFVLFFPVEVPWWTQSITGKLEPWFTKLPLWEPQFWPSTLVSAQHTLIDELSTLPPSVVPAFTPPVRQQELGQLWEAGQTRKERDRLEKPFPIFWEEGYPWEYKKQGGSQERGQERTFKRVQGVSTNVQVWAGVLITLKSSACIYEKEEYRSWI